MSNDISNNEEKKNLKRVLAEINKEYGANTIGTVNEMQVIQGERILSGIPQLDAAIGGGFPLGRTVELYGLPSGGKSLITLCLIAQAQKQGLDCIYIDAENSFDPTFAQKFGVDTTKLIISQSSIGEDTIDLVAKLMPAEPAVVVVDSVAAMITREELEEPMDQQFMAKKARLMARGIPKLNTLNRKNRTLLVFINQLRSTMQMYGPQTTTPGGRTLGYFASLRIEVKKGDFLRVDDKKTTDIIGQVVNFQVTKNKVAPPWKYGSFKFFYDPVKIE